MGIDIYQHFIVGLLLQRLFLKLNVDQITSTGIVLSIAISKEVWDKYTYGSSSAESFKDVIVTLIGNFIGMVI